jgi:hypothetical protein
LEGTSEFLTIDFVVQAHSRHFVVDEEDVDAVRVLFDRAGVIVVAWGDEVQAGSKPSH